MFANYEEIKRRMNYIEQELVQIESMKVEWPQDELICAKNGKHYKWYLKTTDKTIYLPKRERSFAEKLAQKKYYQLRQSELKSELSACRTYIRRAGYNGNLTDKMMENPEYEQLLGNQSCSVGQEIKDWMNAEYERNNSHPENLIVKGTRGRMLRSKSEAIIDRSLYCSGIPFRYEDKLMLDGVVFYPDFTIRHPKTGKFYYWEHFGMMDNPEYVNHACQKIKIYCGHGIIPSVNLILTYETKDHPFGIDSAERIVQEYFL